MTVKQISLHVALGAVLAIIASIIYNTIYTAAFAVDFSSVLNVGGIIGSTTIGCLLMGLGYFLGYKWKGEKLLPWINLLIAVLSFASIVGVLGMQLPLTIESPELFPGLAIPMHFFPALSFIAVAPFFKAKQNSSQSLS
jgi:hypothetical protein